MKLSRRNILLISPESLDHVFVSKHHYAIHLGNRENKVYFLNPPCNSNEIIKTEYRNVWEVNYKGFPRGLRLFPSFLQKYYTNKVFQQLQKLCNVEFDIVWSFDNSVFYDFSALPKSVFSISHIVDLNQNFQTAKAATTANICICTTQYIKDTLLRYNKKVWKINHGYTFEVLKDKFQLPTLHKKIKVGYAGNLDITYIDWHLLLSVIKSNSDVQFYFAGPLKSHDIKQLLRDCENVNYIGKLNSNELVGFYEEMDLLILIYKADEYKEQLANPHKMMEYLGSGKMIVATYTQEYVELSKKGLFLMSNGNSKFPQLFKAALQSLEYWNNKKKRIARQNYAEANTYERQIDKIEQYLKY